jgi:hypothetical protein
VTDMNVSTLEATVSQTAIARRAQELWEEEGRPEGRAHEHWLQAERELALKTRGRGRKSKNGEKAQQ